METAIAALLGPIPDLEFSGEELDEFGFSFSKLARGISRAVKSVARPISKIVASKEFMVVGGAVALACPVAAPAIGAAITSAKLVRALDSPNKTKRRVAAKTIAATVKAAKTDPRTFGRSAQMMRRVFDERQQAKRRNQANLARKRSLARKAKFKADRAAAIARAKAARAKRIQAVNASRAARKAAQLRSARAAALANRAAAVAIASQALLKVPRPVRLLITRDGYPVKVH